jgi:Tn3 transposase DDE domain-containing protein
VLPVGVFRRLAARYRRSPDQLSEEEVRGYLLGLRERGVALGPVRSITCLASAICWDSVSPRASATWATEGYMSSARARPTKALDPLIGGTIDLRLIAENWDEILRLGGSIKAGTVAPSAILRRLAAYPRQNALAKALKEIGRLERTLFTLDWISDPPCGGGPTRASTRVKPDTPSCALCSFIASAKSATGLSKTRTTALPASISR